MADDKKRAVCALVLNELMDSDDEKSTRGIGLKSWKKAGISKTLSHSLELKTGRGLGK